MARGILFLSLFCIGTVATVKAQETKFGLKAGLNYSSVVGDLTDGIKFRFSGQGGVFIESEFTRKFSLQGELLYVSQGFQFSSDLQTIQNEGVISDQNDIRTNVQLNYLTVPIFGKFALNDRVAIEFGPQFGFLLNQVSKIKFLDQRDDTTPVNRTTTSGSFQLDYGVVGGLSIYMNESLSLEPRIYLGLRNRLQGLPGEVQNYNISIQISVNYLLF